MAGIEEGISTVLAYAADDSHGYVLQGRSYDYGTDCAGLVRLYAATVEGVDVAGYPDFHTWNEASVLAARGWQDMTFDYGSARRGDVFLRALGDSTGHTVVYLGGGRIVGAEGDWDGRAGDSSGTEVCERSYYDYGYNHILRPPGVTAVREETKRGQEADEMVCIIQPNDESILMYFDGHDLHDLTHPDDVQALNLVYQQTHGGEDIPTFKLGSSSAPYASRLYQALAAKCPSADVAPSLRNANMLPRGDERDM